MRKHALGFTIVELMVAIAVIAVLIAIAAPNFSNTMKASRVQSQSRELFSHLNYARSEAVSRKRTTLLCHSSDAATCSGTWSDGWVVCVADISATPFICDAAIPVLRVYSDLGNSALSVVNNAPTPVAQDYISFSPNGYASQLSPPDYFTLKICDSTADVNFARAILITGVGQMLESSKNTSTGVFKDVKGGDLVCP